MVGADGTQIQERKERNDEGFYGEEGNPELQERKKRNKWENYHLILQVSLLFKQITFLIHTFYLICFYIYITINLNHIKYTTPHQIQKPLI